MIDLFRASEYARLHRGRRMVFKVGGSCLDRPAHRKNLARQLAVIEAFGVRAIVVHGGGPQTGELQRLFGETPRSIDGRRVTSAVGLRALTMATAGEINTMLAAAITAEGAPAVGICAASAGIVRAEKRPPVATSEGTIDFGLVGDVTGVSVEPLVALSDAGFTPVVCPPVYDGRGGLLNVNADVLAAEIAVALRAAKLVLLTDQPGVLRDPADPKSLLSAITLDELDALGRSGALKSGMAVKGTAVRTALRGGVARVHVVSGLDPEGLLGELYTPQGTGTLVTLEPEGAPAADAPLEKGESVPELSLEGLLLELVRIPSPSGAEEEVARFAGDWLERRGLDVELAGWSVLARIAGRHGPRLMLNSHLDTVPAGEGWLADPWQVAWKDARLVGLGANDAKASAAAMMWAAARIAERGELEGELWLALNACEETTNAGMRAVLDVTGLPDAAVTGEPTGLEVVRAQAGLAVLSAVWTGRSCHAAHVSRVPHRNALLAAARELASLESPWVLEGEHALLGPSTLSATVLHAGDRHNRVPDRAEATFDARIAAPHTAAECVELLRRALPTADVQVKSERLRAVETADEHPLVRAMLECAQKRAAIGSNTLSDMALLQGVPAVKCGPGATARSHTPNEWIEAGELAAGAAFYERAVPAALRAASAGALRS